MSDGKTFTIHADDGQALTIRTEVTFRCAYCMGKAHVAFDPPAVLHDAPECPTYTLMEPLDYLTSCRIAAQKLAAARTAVA